MSRSAIVGRVRLLTMAGAQVGQTEVIEGPWVIVIEDGRVAEVRAGDLRVGDPDDVTDVGDALVTPGLVDPHTHLCFAGDRADEAAARSRGEPYTGGGILRSVRSTTESADEVLVAATRARLESAAASGTTTIEVKSGYGLTAEQELRQLRLIGEAAVGLPLRVLRTYLGAHAVPDGSSAADQAAAVITALPEVAPLADFVDVFCEPTIFDLSLTRAILEAGRAHGLGLRLHADQLARSGAAMLGIELGVLSVDHLERATDQDARAIAVSDTVATILPGPALLLRGGRPPVRALIDAGATVAIGSDANAGTFGTPSMPMAIGLAVALGFSVDEALWAATAGAAHSLGLAGQVGILQPGATADLIAWGTAHEGDFALRLGAVMPIRRWFGGHPDDDPDLAEYQEDSLAALRAREERESAVACPKPRAESAVMTAGMGSPGRRVTWSRDAALQRGDGSEGSFVKRQDAGRRIPSARTTSDASASPSRRSRCAPRSRSSLLQLLAVEAVDDEGSFRQVAQERQLGVDAEPMDQVVSLAPVPW